MPGLTVTIRCGGAPALKHDGCFMAAPATRPFDEPHAIVILCSLEDRSLFISEAPESLRDIAPMS